jgi:predicted transcriptional regulator
MEAGGVFAEDQEPWEESESQAWESDQEQGRVFVK